MTFRVTARDNRITGGGIRGAEVAVSIVSAAGPFKVTAPAGGSHAGVIEVKWDVAQTNVAPIQTQFVNILLSTDGGQNYSTALATNSPNDGQQLVALPSTVTSTARIKVEAVGNVFFNISDAFSIVQARSVAIFVRHAEKASNTGDPPLSPAGSQRAQALSHELANCDVREVRATDTQRAQLTAAPTAQLAGVSVDEYSDITDLCDRLTNLTDGRTTLVVGHSDTVPQMVQKLKPDTAVTISENQFDRMFVVIQGADNQTTVLQRSYSGGVTPLSGPAPLGRVANSHENSLVGDDLRSDLNQLRKEVQELRDELKKFRPRK